MEVGQVQRELLVTALIIAEQARAREEEVRRCCCYESVPGEPGTPGGGPVPSYRSTGAPGYRLHRLEFAPTGLKAHVDPPLQAGTEPHARFRTQIRSTGPLGELGTLGSGQRGNGGHPASRLI